MSDIIDENSAEFLALTDQLYASFLEDHPSRSVVIYEVTKWDEFVFTYNHGNKIDPDRLRKMPIAMDKWQGVLPVPSGVYMRFDGKRGAFKGSYLHLIWPESYPSKAGEDGTDLCAPPTTVIF